MRSLGIGAFYSLILALALVVPHATFAQDGFGGVRSNGNIREQVQADMVPHPDAFAIEGMLAEHNFPVKEERCKKDMCVFTAIGHGLHIPTDTRSAYLFVEPISGLEPGKVERAPQNLAVVIDRSGSMSGWKMASALEAVHNIIKRLGKNDRLAIVAFDTEAELILPSTPVRNKRKLHQRVDRIAAGGTTNIHDAMKMGFEQLAAYSDEWPASRLIVLTDERPNVGDTSKEGFLELTGTYAKQGISLSILGVGLDLGTELAFSVSQLRGGSYHYLENAEQTEKLFGEDFESFLTPVATDLVIRIEPGPGLRVADVFGVPEDQVFRKSNGEVVVRAATVFFDRRRSGAVVRLEPAEGTPNAALAAGAKVSWSYVQTKGELTQTGESRVVHKAREVDSLAEFESPDHYRGYALVNFAELLKHSLFLWHDGKKATAIDVLRLARGALVLDAWIISDTELQKERELADDLLANMLRYSRGYFG